MQPRIPAAGNIAYDADMDQIVSPPQEIRRIETAQFVEATEYPGALLKDHTFHINIEHDGIISWWCECPDWYSRNIPVKGSETFIYLHVTEVDPDRVGFERPGNYIVGDSFDKRIYPKTVTWERVII